MKVEVTPDAAPLPSLTATGGSTFRRGPVARLWSQFFAAAYDPMNRGAESAGVASWRTELLAQAGGDVLELGAGTGTNLDHYPAKGIESLTLSEPDRAMFRRLSRRTRHEGAIRLVEARAEELPMPNDSVDTVVATYVLCSVDPARAMAEVRRVLRPDGQVLFCEHIRAREPGLARRQDRINRLWRMLACGCNCNRETERHLNEAGFEITSVEYGEVERELSIVRPTVRGRAVVGKQNR